ncbi:MAG: indole-3-glycerol phosphate synthase TrpC [Deltaproteobacteria bacterium]|nr:indole-3-glycerol phosphate synthase TrpC [Deltaproteobacteria bacterium]
MPVQEQYQMHDKLKEIIEEKKREIKFIKRQGLPDMDREIPSVRNFMDAISVPGVVNLIAEIKFASPSAGVIREKTDPVDIGRLYEKTGAAAISLLTDKKFFSGDLEYLPRLKEAVGLPVLRKDFMIDPVQVKEAFLYGADAILLIARILSEDQLKEMLSVCHEFGMYALTEIHDMDDLEKAINAEAKIVGINNRDLDTFRISLDTTKKLARGVPKDRVLVSESGIKSAEDVASMKDLGVNAVLIGSAIMQDSDPVAKIGKFLSAGGHKIT